MIRNFLPVLIFTLVSDLDVARAETFVYVSAKASKQVVVYRMQVSTGELDLVERVQAGGEPGALTTTPDRQFLFAALRAEGKLAAFRIAPRSGRLEAVNVVPAGADPAHLRTDPTGRFLFTAYYAAGKLSVHSVGPSGALSEKPIQEFVTDTKAHNVAIDPSGHFVFISHTAPNRIFQSVWDASKRRLTPNNPAWVNTPPRTGPRHMAWHPTRPVAYVDNEQGSSVTSYRLDGATGLLTPVATSSTLPADFTGANSCAEIKVHPNGRYAYVSNRGHNSIAIFRIGDTAERLVSLGQIPTEPTPRSIEIDPSGRFLLVAGEGSGQLAVYRIAEPTGTPSQTHRYAIGPELWWVLAIELPRSDGE